MKRGIRSEEELSQAKLKFQRMMLIDMLISEKRLQYKSTLNLL